MSLTEVSRQLRLNKSTALRLLSVLEQHHYVEKCGAGGNYSLGSRLIELGLGAVSRLDLLQLARPKLDRLVQESGETAHLGVLRDGRVLSLANVESPRTLRTPATVGGRSPAHCTSIGKAILAFRSLAEVKELVNTHGLKKYTDFTITTLADFLAELDRVRKNGYGMDNEEYELGLRCLGAPVRDHSTKVIAAVSVTGPAFRLTEDRIPDLAALVVEVASELSAGLGYQGN
jgi:DNA-binding IclR family transcriptional regulator